MANLQANLSQISLAQKQLGDDEMFRACVADTLAMLNVEDIDFANELAVSRSTVNRWKHGKAAPHPAMRKPVYAALKRRVSARLRQDKLRAEAVHSSELSA
jgi:transcriptional regulator with XRE-family HTH domain